MQRVPPTEKRGRVHTSTVTVAVIDPSDIPDTSKYDMVEEDHFRIEWFSGTGKGGQRRNKKQCCCRVIHIPTGLMESRQGRSRENNLRDAKQGILMQLGRRKEAVLYATVNDKRYTQVGTGQRADKIRTYRFQDDVVTDHISNKRASCKSVMKGKMNLLW